MSEINVKNLTFSYDTSYDNIFENVSFKIDTEWKLGFIGRNGKGKTTFLKLLQNQYEYVGAISKSVEVDYFPYEVLDQEKKVLSILKEIIAPYEKWERKMEKAFTCNTEESLNEYSKILEQYLYYDGYHIETLIEKELGKLDVETEVLARPFTTLSNGERTKVLLAALFLKKNNFLLIDEPTNHLDQKGRKIVREYLKQKQGFILVSHDRDFLDHIIDHVLSINKSNIELSKGNFTVWQENKARQDEFEIRQNEKLGKEIHKLENAFRRTAGWSNQIEKSKIGTHASDRGAIGHKAAKMMKRAKTIERHQLEAIEQKSLLKKNIEEKEALRINTLPYHKERYIIAEELVLGYGKTELFSPVSFEIKKGDRIVLEGLNGSGKSSILKFIIQKSQDETLCCLKGNVRVGAGVKISYLSQDTSFLKGDLKNFAEKNRLDETLFKMALRKLDFDRKQFDKKIEEFSEGQKKKVLLAKSLIEPAHIFIWDEPLNYIDILSRIQVEELLLTFLPTMIFVEHDIVFTNKIATKRVQIR